MTLPQAMVLRPLGRLPDALLCLSAFFFVAHAVYSTAPLDERGRTDERIEDCGLESTVDAWFSGLWWNNQRIEF